MSRPVVLVTGGAGYIGSHTCKALWRAGYQPVVFDNLVHGHKHAVKWGPLVVGDLVDISSIRAALSHYQPEAVIHFAAYAYVGESVQKPGKYYKNNVSGTLSLLEAMVEEHVDTIVFSSTCATYGIPKELPIREDMPQAPINPYGHSKLMIEQVLEDFRTANGLSYAALRYFNAAGCDGEGELFEEHDPEPHLIPRALMARAGIIPHLDVFGHDYATPDGTCIRDYIHVEDLAEAHIKALETLRQKTEPTSLKLNLGTGRGYSVREVLDAIERITGKPVPIKAGPRRAGDPPSLYADCTKAKEQIGFVASRSGLDNIVKTAWQQFSPKD